jgi:hypothetical protein
MGSLSEMYDPFPDLEGSRRRARLRDVLTHCAMALILTFVPLALAGAAYAGFILISMVMSGIATELGDFIHPTTVAVAPSLR